MDYDSKILTNQKKEKKEKEKENDSGYCMLFLGYILIIYIETFYEKLKKIYKKS